MEYINQMETMWMTGEEEMHTEDEIEAMRQAEEEEYTKHKDDDKIAEGSTLLERTMGKDFKTFFTA